MQIENLQKLFVEELKDTYDAEHQLVDALEEMAAAARSPQLKRAFTEHRRETQSQAQRLEKVFRALGEEPERKTCKAMKGLIEEGSEIAKADGDDDSVDAGIIGAAQKVEHYEIAAYGTLRTFALTLGRRDEAQLLQEILDEESATDEKLTGLAVSKINPEAAEATGNGETGGMGARLGSLLSSLGIKSRFFGSGQQEGGSTGRGSSRSSGGRKTGARGGAKKTSSRSAAARSGGRSSGASKSAASKSGASKSGGRKSNGNGASRSASGGSKSGARKGAARKAGARKAGAHKAGAHKSAARKGATQSARGSKSGGRSRSRKSSGSSRTQSR